MRLPLSKILKLEKRDPACWHCGTTEGLVIHHRKNRGMGGRPSLDHPANYLRICASYNQLIEADAQAAEIAREKGHKLRQFESFETPAFDATTSEWWVLTDDWQRKPADQVELPLF